MEIMLQKMWRGGFFFCFRGRLLKRIVSPTSDGSPNLCFGGNKITNAHLTRQIYHTHTCHNQFVSTSFEKKVKPNVRNDTPCCPHGVLMHKVAHSTGLLYLACRFGKRPLTLASHNLFATSKVICTPAPLLTLFCSAHLNQNYYTT